jgi:uncharacterized membrane protein YtjA (UPF0391 family)
MFSATVLYLFAALLTGWLGFGTLAGHAARVAKVLCVAFLVLFIIGVMRDGGGG